MLVSAERICLAAGLALCLTYALVRADGAVGRTDAIAAFYQQASGPDEKLWSAARVAAYAKALVQPIENPLALLRVASVGIDVPVFEHESDLALNRGASLIAGMGTPDGGGNVGIAAHRDGFFRPLKDVRLGDIIELRTISKLHRYKVTSIDIVPSDDPRLLADTEDPTLTLITCYPFYYVGSAPQRYVVRADYVW